jgi:hypothetical protein
MTDEERRVQAIAIKICKLVRVKQQEDRPTHALPQIAVVLNKDRKEVHIMAQNFPALSKHGKILARTLHQESWIERYGNNADYFNCDEITEVENHPSPQDWIRTLGELRGLGYTVILSKKFE